MENAIYWQGVQVGIESCGLILWFTNAPAEAIECLSASASKLESIKQGIMRG